MRRLLTVCLSCLSVCMSENRILQKVVDEFGWNLISQLDMGQKRSG